MPVLASEPPREHSLHPLENGEHLRAEEFLRRYEAAPELKKAELIQGIVFMGSPVRARQHGIPDALVQSWLGMYAAFTPGVDHAINSTICLSNDDVPQPDGILLLRPEQGGTSRIDPQGYVAGPPELVLEVAASSTAIDCHEKRESYAAYGVQEYLLWRTMDQELDWWFLKEGRYQPLTIDAEGILRSRIFPGLWLNRRALLQLSRREVMDCLQRGLESPEHQTFLTEVAARARPAGD